MTPTVTVFVPPRLHGTTFETIENVNGQRVPATYTQRVHNGHIVVDMPVGVFLNLLKGPHGLELERSNAEVMSWLGETDRRTMFNNAFPGEQRPAPVKHDPSPVAMVKLAAPVGLSGISVEGSELVIGTDGTVVVTSAIADTLRSHGFKAVA